MRGNPRQRVLSIAAVTCLALLVADRTLLQPLLKSYRGRAQRIRVLEAELNKAQLMAGQAEAWKARLRDFEERALPGDASEAESVLITAVQRWAGTSRLDLTATRPRWTDEEDGKSKVFELRISATGSLEAVARFLYDVETSSMPLRVTNLTVASTSTNPRLLTLTVDVHAVLWNPGTPVAGDAS